MNGVRWDPKLFIRYTDGQMNLKKMFFIFLEYTLRDCIEILHKHEI